MAMPTQMKQIAIGIANSLHMRALNAEKEPSETSKAQIEAQLEHAKLAYNRAIGFQPQVHGIFQCPRCWVADEARTVLMPVEGGTNTEHSFKCQICGIVVAPQPTKNV
jgi:hypothetical protein